MTKPDVDECKDVMVDIETMSTHPTNALVLSIGAVGFTVFDGAPQFGAKFDTVLDLREQLLLGRGVDPDTQAFWGGQPKAASAPWVHGAVESLVPALNRFAEFLVPYERVWANGIVFDIGNLETLYRATQVAVPWKYNATRDARTIYRCFPASRTRPADAANQNAHDPIADCMSQIWGLWESNVPALHGQVARG